MIDGCPDGWVGTGIPVCVLGSGTAQQEPSSPRAASRDGSLMKERDYIGLGLANQEEGSHLQNASIIQSAQEKMECDNVELSLGLGLPEKATQRSVRVEQFVSTGFQFDLSEAHAKSKLASPGAKPQHFWHHTFRVNLSNNDQLQNGNFQADSTANVLKNYAACNAQTWGVASGRLAVPVPKISSIPAKRPFAEAAGERRLSPPTPNHAASVEASMPCATAAPAGMYVWNGEPSTGGAVAGVGWQQAHVSMEQGPSHSMGGMVNSSFVHPRQLSALPPHFQALQAGVGAPLPSVIKPSMAPNSAGLQAAGALKAEMENENTTSNAPVVGWPPVRTYRKNTLQAVQSNRMTSAEMNTKSAGGPTGAGMEGGEQMNGNHSKNAFFVKAKLDGVRICRKVDLQAYNSFEGLKSALQDMFQGFVSDNAKLDLLHGSNYVVTHEDKDGECWFVGDGTWSMFVGSGVRSLRIMKSMDATSIGDKSAKLRAQASGKP